MTYAELAEAVAALAAHPQVHPSTTVTVELPLVHTDGDVSTATATVVNVRVIDQNMQRRIVLEGA